MCDKIGKLYDPKGPKQSLRERIYTTMKKRGYFTDGELVALLGANPHSVRRSRNELVQAGRVENSGGKWRGSIDWRAV